MTRLKKVAADEQELDSSVPEGYTNSKYHIVAGGGIGEMQGSKETNDPKQAIQMWVDMQKMAPMDVSIISMSAPANELLDWARANKEDVREMLQGQNVYKSDYLVDNMLPRAHASASYDKYGGDQVYPFCAG